MMDFSVFDMRGNEIVEGDTVVYSYVNGSSSYLRIGVVSEKKITERIFDYPNHYLKIRWVEGRTLPDKPTLIRVTPNEKSHLLKVELDGIN